MGFENREIKIGGSEGRELEIGLFGALRADDPKYRELFLKYADKRTGWVSPKQSLELVKKFQPFDPLAPKRPFASKLLRSTREILKLENEEGRKRVKFYTAVAPSTMPAKVAPLDFWYGIDAFIEMEQEDKKSIMVTFDVTGKDKKDDPKADIVIYEKELSDKKVDEAVKEVAEKAVAALISKSIKH